MRKHIGAVQVRHLARKAERREAWRNGCAVDSAPAKSARTAQRKRLEAVYLAGLLKSPSVAGFHTKKRSAKHIPMTRSNPRAADTYRGAKYNADLGKRAAALKADRLARGETRSQADIPRWAEARA